MEKSDKLVSQGLREIAASPKISPTAAGPSERPTITTAQIDAINQVFTLFRLNYHNQYYKAYPGDQELMLIKKLWAESLHGFSTEQILRATRALIAESEFLPNINRMLQYCQKYSQGLPSAREAYLEACNAPSPKADYQWSHPLVYHAGAETGWYNLANEPEKISFQTFEATYNRLCRRLADGEIFSIERPALPETPRPALSKKENRQRLQSLRKQLDL